MSGYRPRPLALQTERLSLRRRRHTDATWNLELLGEREGGTERTLREVEVRLVEQRAQAIKNGFGFVAIRQERAWSW